MTLDQVDLILEIIDLKIQLTTLTNRADRDVVREQIDCREQDLRDTCEDEE